MTVALIAAVSGLAYVLVLFLVLACVAWLLLELGAPRWLVALLVVVVLLAWFF